MATKKTTAILIRTTPQVKKEIKSFANLSRQSVPAFILTLVDKFRANYFEKNNSLTEK
jgi:hypothetical protein